MINIVLVEPEIPQNTGNIVRTCAGCHARLHLVRPLGFSTDDRYLKRAGLDYWYMVDISYYDCFDDVLARAAKEESKGQFYYCTTKGKLRHSDVRYGPDDWLVFGKETKGLPESLLAANYDHCIRIPMRPEFRSLNLSNAVAIVAFEAMRQLDYPDMESAGALREYKL